MPSGFRMFVCRYWRYGIPDTFATIRPRIANPKFEYSYAVPGAVENGMPRVIISAIPASVAASWRSPQGLSSGNPSACDSRCLIVMRGESAVG